MFHFKKCGSNFKLLKVEITKDTKLLTLTGFSFFNGILFFCPLGTFKNPASDSNLNNSIKVVGFWKQ